MDAECAFCGRAGAATREVYCDDCRARHSVCAPCADETATDNSAVPESDLYLHAA